jgi:Uma2 family endonuclease
VNKIVTKAGTRRNGVNGVVRVGPRDHGRHMSLKEFDHAEVVPGYLYELSRGVITVSDVPRPSHLAQVQESRDQFIVYKFNNPGRIHTVCGGGESKLLVWDFESERHPDVSVYKKRPPRVRDVWTKWIPDVAIEVVSRGLEKRDYEEKSEEYLRFGVREYWIIDHARQQMLVLRRFRDRWTEKIVQPGEGYRTRLLPGFEFDLARVFAAAGK